MWCNQPTPTKTERSTSVGVGKITAKPQPSPSCISHQIRQRCCPALGVNPTWKVPKVPRTPRHKECSIYGRCARHWTNGDSLHVIFLKVNITIFSDIPWQSCELWVCGDSAVGDINPTEKARWHIFYTVSSSLSLHFLHRLQEAMRGEETRRVEEPQEWLWVSGQVLQ